MIPLSSTSGGGTPLAFGRWVGATPPPPPRTAALDDAIRRSDHPGGRAGGAHRRAPRLRGGHRHGSRFERSGDAPRVGSGRRRGRRRRRRTHRARRRHRGEGDRFGIATAPMPRLERTSSAIRGVKGASMVRKSNPAESGDDDAGGDLPPSSGEETTSYEGGATGKDPYCWGDQPGELQEGDGF